MDICEIGVNFEDFSRNAISPSTSPFVTIDTPKSKLANAECVCEDEIENGEELRPVGPGRGHTVHKSQILT